MMARAPALRRRMYSLLGVVLALATPSAGVPLDEVEAPLVTAAERGDLKLVTRLAAAKDQLYARDAAGRSGLIAAAGAGRLEVVRFLLGKRPDLDARDMGGQSALHHAARSGHAAVVEALLAAGLDAALYDKHCHPPWAIAAGFSRKKPFELLSAAFLTRPVPADGTAEECDLAGPPKVPAFTAAGQLYQARELRIEGPADYRYVNEALSRLTKDRKMGKRMLREIAGVVDHRSPEEAPHFAPLDAGMREQAIATLDVLATAPAERRLVTDAMTAILAGGGCQGLHATVCTAVVRARCERSDEAPERRPLARTPSSHSGNAPRPKPLRTTEAETCFNCRFCESTRVGHAYAAALTWFQRRPEEAARARAALTKLASGARRPGAQVALRELAGDGGP
jgi:hypothetical protein